MESQYKQLRGEKGKGEKGKGEKSIRCCMTDHPLKNRNNTVVQHGLLQKQQKKLFFPTGEAMSTKDKREGKTPLCDQKHPIFN